MSKLKLIIVGLGETAELAYDYFTCDSEYEVVAFAAEEKYFNKINIKTLEGLPVISLEGMSGKYPIGEYSVFVAMSYTKLNHDRCRVYQIVKSMGYTMASYVSSKAFVSRNVRIGENCFILENNVLQRNVKIGNNVTLWSGNHIGHRSVIEDHVFLSSHVAVSGFCHIGKFCFLGINSCLGDNVTVADNCFIGGGVSLLHDSKNGEIYRMSPTNADKLSTKQVWGYKDEMV